MHRLALELSGKRTIIHKMFDWPLNTNTFSFSDKLRMSYFLLSCDRWTQGEKVKEYEKLWEEYVGCKAIMVSSGSAANELIALKAKSDLIQKGLWPNKNKVLFPANTWISSVSPWVNLGFEAVFVDIDENLGMDLDKLCVTYNISSIRGRFAGVFYTTLLGFVPESILNIQNWCSLVNLPFYLDNCESSFSSINIDGQIHNINSVATSSTSFYLSHLTTTGSEGGMVFCEDEEDHKWFLMARNHGMVKSLLPYYGSFETDNYRNWGVDERFDFRLLGSNYRSSDLAAFAAILDFENRDKIIIHRTELYQQFKEEIKKEVKIPEMGLSVPFCLPIIVDDVCLLNNIKFFCHANGIEYRPIVGGNLLRQTAFKGYGKPESFPYADYIHKHGIYIGLNTQTTPKMIDSFVKGISKL